MSLRGARRHLYRWAKRILHDSRQSTIVRR